MSLPRTLLVVVAAATTLAAGTDCAYACTCVPRSAGEIFASGDTVVDGLVVEVQHQQRRIVAFVAVDAVYAGSADALLRVTTDVQESACGLPLRAGERWVIVGTPAADGIRTGLCSGSARGTELIEERTPIATPRALPPPGADRSVPAAPSGLLVVSAVGFVLAASAMQLIGRRRVRPRP